MSFGKGFWNAVQSFFDVRHRIKAKIFISFTLATIVFVAGISVYWYRLTIRSTTDALVDNMDKNLNSSLSQLENSVEDVQKMHATLLYETNSMDYIIKDDFDPPESDWFDAYNDLYSSMRMMGVNLSRTVSGIGVFKTNGETCLSGTLSLDTSVFRLKEIQELKQEKGNDKILFLKKNDGESQNEVMQYVFVGRSVLDRGREKAVLITRLNESIFKRIFSENVYPNGFVLLTNASGDIIYDSSPEAFQQEKEQCIQQPTIESVGDFMTFSSRSPHTGMTMISAVPYRYIQEINRNTGIQLTILLIIVIAMIAILSMLIANQISKGLQKLSDNMKKVGTGSMSELSVINTSDEVGQLNESFLNMTNQIEQLLEDIRQNEEQKRKMEIKVLRAQISPHFLYNSLNTINYLAMLQHSENIHSLTSSLIELLQGAVNIDDRLISLTDEVKYAKSYINVQQYRFPQEIQVDYQIDPQVLSCKVPKMILQPIIENALIHGLSENKVDGLLRIKAYMFSPKELVFTIMDNGIGMSGDKINEVMQKTDNQDRMRFSGIGIGNVDSRIKMQFGDEYGISIYSQKQMFTMVEIHLPVMMEATDNVSPETDQGGSST